MTKTKLGGSELSDLQSVWPSLRPSLTFGKTSRGNWSMTILTARQEADAAAKAR